MDRTHEILSTVNYRLLEEKDIEGVLKLWKEESGWGGISLVQFKSWFTDTPYGDCIIVIAAGNNDEVLGQIIFTPARLFVRGAEIKALRVSAPILRSDYRFTGTEFKDHPICKMFYYGISIAILRNYALAYIFPAKGWLRGIKAISNQFINWETYTFDGFSIPLDTYRTRNTEKDHRLLLTVASNFNQDYDQLWDDAKNNFSINCGIVRKKDWLQYRLGSHLTIESRDSTNGMLMGYCTLKKNSGLLVDMLARNKNDLERTLTGVIKMLDQSNPYRIPVQFNKITGMHTTVIHDFERSLCIEPLDYKFDFGCCVLNQSINPEFVKPTEWYMMPDV